jgi:hypothetical protein
MLVKRWMSTPAITINVDATIQDAIVLLKQYEIRIFFGTMVVELPAFSVPVKELTRDMLMCMSGHMVLIR